MVSEGAGDALGGLPAGENPEKDSASSPKQKRKSKTPGSLVSTTSRVTVSQLGMRI